MNHQIPLHDIYFHVDPIHRIGWYCAATRFGGSFLRIKRTRAIGTISVNCGKEKEKRITIKPAWLHFLFDIR
jgi:hypothetical protein